MKIHSRQVGFLLAFVMMQFFGSPAAADLFSAHLIGMKAEELQTAPCRSSEQSSSAEHETQTAETSWFQVRESAAASFGEWHPNVIAAPQAFHASGDNPASGRCLGCDYYRWPTGIDLHGGGYCGHD